MEPIQAYKPNDHEMEVASNSYLMSFIVLTVGLPLPIINLVSSVIFYLGNRKKTFYIRWHCTQALLTQLISLPLNSIGFWWTIHIIFGDAHVSSRYIAYVITLLSFFIMEFIFTIITATRVRKGTHVEWWVCGPFSSLICKP